jgi:STAS-like domain of unknown function (DUF4325)
MPYCYALADHGSTLATRPLGNQLRTGLVEKAAGESAVELDFSGVLSTSHSFADEFVARLAEEVELGHVGFQVTVSGASTNVERVVLKALERRSVDLPLLV